ncbi:MAG: hypothetical protein AB8H03_09835 [Saprospiraceae bacterium]
MNDEIKVFIFFILLISSCGFPTVEESGLRYSTKPSLKVPENIQWEKIGLAKEMINIREKTVVLSGGTNPIPLDKWEDFKVQLPWKKNIDRNILFTKTALIRSPNADVDCKDEACIIEREFKGYTWIELADPIAIDFIPKETDTMKPEEGHLTIKVIKKCQIIIFEDEIIEMSDDKGNKYVMHATESGKPNLAVKLPHGFSLKKIKLDAPLLIVPFGKEGDCYLNIVGDHLGQGYHQYKYTNEYYPK